MKIYNTFSGGKNSRTKFCKGLLMLCIKINQALSNAQSNMFNGIGAALLELSSLDTALIPEI
ncbi:hypothetical protein [Clostridium sp. ZBS18]|uniref:hypothetical protein n=1 Tax=Clostridium sp. ZBS18 TaxID=2949967 RepID=UPI00207AEBB1|nr:hypothetical protein [Clostridium sp. ZBS18]